MLVGLCLDHSLLGLDWAARVMTRRVGLLTQGVWTTLKLKRGLGGVQAMARARLEQQSHITKWSNF
jgi:hypothetical protein